LKHVKNENGLGFIFLFIIEYNIHKRNKK